MWRRLPGYDASILADQTYRFFGTFLVPLAPGGSTEIMARSAASELSQTLGQTVFVENKSGASGNAVMAECAKSLDANRDFKPILSLGKVASLYVTNAEIPAKNLKGIIVKPNPNPNPNPNPAG